MILALPLLAWAGNALYALGVPGGWLKQYSPALVAPALIVYAILHARARYGGQASWHFVLIVFAIAWVFETLSVITGFPFGNYHYTDIMAPYLWHIPVFVLPAYALMGYASWSLAGLILGRLPARPDIIGCVLIPPLAAMAMVIGDMSMDPLRATVEARWVWLDGGAHFGVPVSNYFGWFGVTWLMFQAFALYLRRSPARALPRTEETRAYWISVPLAYSAFAGEYLLNPFTGHAAGRVVEVNGVAVPLGVLYSEIAVLCLVTMIPLTALGLLAALRPVGGAADGAPGRDPSPGQRWQEK